MRGNGNYRVISAINEALFGVEERRLSKIIDNLHLQNQEANGKSADYFGYEGKGYMPSSCPKIGMKTRIPLHHSLVDQMKEYLVDFNQVTEDRKLIGQIMFLLIEPCQTEQDYRDALPDCLVETLPSVSRLDRMRPEAFTITGNERAQRQYAKALPRMQFYSAVRLIY